MWRIQCRECGQRAPQRELKQTRYPGSSFPWTSARRRWADGPPPAGGSNAGDRSPTQKELAVQALTDFAKSWGRDATEVLAFAQSQPAEAAPQPVGLSTKNLQYLPQRRIKKERELESAAHRRLSQGLTKSSSASKTMRRLSPGSKPPSVEAGPTLYCPRSCKNIQKIQQLWWPVWKRSRPSSSQPRLHCSGCGHGWAAGGN
ncbi:unnamed protein product [Prorocentrum cordatum]|uniref:Uncharacterized protein n=1 Tax=Prorocentrum cordatum TaxID=2364126 RepID=A0ABN9XV92_9DINO|nr:unnamed protein product [Polarella glacialis]